jgi:hypothetical protein
MRIKDMATTYENLAHKFAPQLYYKKSLNPFENITPEDMGGLYWQLVKDPIRETEFCIQYIAYFHYQHWTPSIFDRFSGKLPGEHPNDYVPIFLYFENGGLVKAVFDICHYEAVGAITATSELLPQDRRPKLHVRNFYRGLLPLEDEKGYSLLKGDPISLSREHLAHWWDGRTPDGSYDDKAKLIIKEKLENPFQEIATFRDHAGTLGRLFDLIFKLKKGGYTVSLSEFSPEDIDSAEEFVDKNILEKSEILEYVTLREH